MIEDYSGGCRRFAYSRRLEGDLLRERCREDRDIEREQKHYGVLDATAIDQLAAPCAALNATTF